MSTTRVEDRPIFHPGTTILNSRALVMALTKATNDPDAKKQQFLASYIDKEITWLNARRAALSSSYPFYG